MKHWPNVTELLVRSLSPRHLPFIKCSQWRESTLETIATHLPVNKDQRVFNSLPLSFRFLFFRFFSLSLSLSISIGSGTSLHVRRCNESTQDLQRQRKKKLLMLLLMQRWLKNPLSSLFLSELTARYGCCFCCSQVDCKFFSFPPPPPMISWTIALVRQMTLSLSRALLQSISVYGWSEVIFSSTEGLRCEKMKRKERETHTDTEKRREERESTPSHQVGVERARWVELWRGQEKRERKLSWKISHTCHTQVTQGEQCAKDVVFRAWDWSHPDHENNKSHPERKWTLREKKETKEWEKWRIKKTIGCSSASLSHESKHRSAILKDSQKRLSGQGSLKRESTRIERRNISPRKRRRRRRRRSLAGAWFTGAFVSFASLSNEWRVRSKELA